MHDANECPPRGGRVLIVDDENGVRDLLSRWLEAGGGEWPRPDPGAKKAKKMLDWTPAFALDDGLERTIRWYRENLS